MSIWNKSIFEIGPKTGMVLLFIAIPVIIYTSFSSTDTAPSSKPYTPDEIELHIQAQQFVKQGLKSPSTAEFPALPYDATTDGNGLYRVISYVDSQNSFGAMIRSDWSVTMRLTGENWTLEKLVIGNKLIYDATTSN